MSRARVFGSLCVLVFLMNLGRVIFAPLLEPLRTSFGLTAGVAGLVATLAWAGSALPRLPAAYVVTRVPRDRMVIGTGGVLTVAATLTALANSTPTLLAGAFLMGLGSGGYFVAANPLVSELYPERVGRAIGVHGTAAQLAAAGAPLLVLLVLLVSDWRAAIGLVAVAAATSTAVFAWVARRTDVPTGRADRGFVTAIRAQWRLVLTGVAIIGVAGFVWNGVFNFYVSYLTTAKGVSPDTARTLLAVMFAAGVPAFWYTGRLADRYPKVPLLLTILGGFVASLITVTVATGFLAILATTLLLGYVIHGIYPALDAYLLDSLPGPHRAGAYGVYSAVVGVFAAGGSVTVGTLVDAGVRYDVVFRVFALAVAAVLVGLLLLYANGRLPDGSQEIDG